MVSSILKALVVDDEKPARDELKYLLSFEKGLSVVGEADSGPSAIQMAASLQPNVIFLDVEMRGLNGLETAKVLRPVVPGALIVFATAYDEYAVKAFEVGAVDYVLKPFESDRIHAAVSRLKSYLPQEWVNAAERVDAIIAGSKIVVQKLPVEKNGKIVLINYNDILYAYARLGTATAVTAEDEFNFHGTLAEMEERVRGANLVRVHKSYIVNMDKVQEIIPWFKGTYWLKVEGRPDIEIPVSKSQIKEVKDMLGLK